MRIEDVRTVPGLSGFFFDDQRAIKDGATQSGFAYDGQPVTEGFDRIREAGEALIVEIELADGSIATGDCAAVQYSGAGGRDPLFRAEKYRPVVEGPVADALRGQDATQFGANATMLEEMDAQRSGGDQLHTAVRYGVSQALLNAAAQARGVTPTDVLADTYDTEPATSPVPVFGQSGDERRINAEKMLIKAFRSCPTACSTASRRSARTARGCATTSPGSRTGRQRSGRSRTRRASTSTCTASSGRCSGRRTTGPKLPTTSKRCGRLPHRTPFRSRDRWTLAVGRHR